MGLRQGWSVAPCLFLIYMNKIVKKGKSCGGVKIDDCIVHRLFFADDPVLLDFTLNVFQHALDKSLGACSVA